MELSTGHQAKLAVRLRLKVSQSFFPHLDGALRIWPVSVRSCRKKALFRRSALSGIRASTLIAARMIRKLSKKMIALWRLATAAKLFFSSFILINLIYLPDFALFG
jgi:hypothetical protein